MITITNEMICGNIAYENGEYRISGDYKIAPDTKKLNTLNISVTKNNVFFGNANVYRSGDELGCNYNDMKQDYASDIADEITALVSELEAKYSSMALTSI